MEIHNKYKIANNKSQIFPDKPARKKKKTLSRNAHRSLVDIPNIENQKPVEPKLEIER